jgi:S-adenosylmethionine hydrolase
MSHPILTLTTDFGLDDHYVGTMKGVILGICPDAQIVDISHGVRPFAIAEGAYTIAQAWRYFLPGTVHVVVVDPGVGTSRRPILVEAGGQFFVGPDNGVLSMVYLREPATVRLIANERLFRHPVSRTFHGRDIFSPVAAHLASGVAPAEIGETIADFLKPDFVSPRREDPHIWTGQVLKVDHFGNVITNFHVDEFADLGRFRMSIGRETIDVLARSYAECASGALFVIVGSSRYYEVSVAQGSAAAKIGCETGAVIELQVS